MLFVLFYSRDNDVVALREGASATVVDDSYRESVGDQGVQVTPHVGRLVDSDDVLSGSLNPVLTSIPGDLVGVAGSGVLGRCGVPADSGGEVGVEGDYGSLGGAGHGAVAGHGLAGCVDHGGGHDGGGAVSERSSIDRLGTVAGGAVSKGDGDGGADFGAAVAGDGQEAGLSFLDVDGEARQASDDLAVSEEVVGFVGRSLGVLLEAPEEVDGVHGVVVGVGGGPAHGGLVGGLLGDGEGDSLGGQLVQDGGSVLGLALVGLYGETAASRGSSSDATLNDSVIHEHEGVHGQVSHGDHASGGVPGASAGVLGPDAGVISVTVGSSDLELEVLDVDIGGRARAQHAHVVNPVHLERVFAALGHHLARWGPLHGAPRSEDGGGSDGGGEVADILSDEDAAVGLIACSVHEVAVEAEGVNAGEAVLTGGLAVEFDRGIFVDPGDRDGAGGVVIVQGGAIQMVGLVNDNVE